MATYIKTLKEDNGDITYPETLASAVYVTGGGDVETALSSKATTASVSNKIDKGDVQTSDIASSAVTTAKIDDGAVTTAKIDDSAVTTAKINDGAVTAAKMDTQSYSLTSLPAHSGGTDRYKVYRMGNFVVININSIWLNSVTKDSWTTLGALPAGLYPLSSDDEQCGSATVVDDSGNVIGSCALIVNSSGDLQFKSGVARTGLSAIRGEMSYVITW